MQFLCSMGGLPKGNQCSMNKIVRCLLLSSVNSRTYILINEESKFARQASLLAVSGMPFSMGLLGSFDHSNHPPSNTEMFFHPSM